MLLLYHVFVPVTRDERCVTALEFDVKESAYYSFGAEDSRVLEVVANRYIGANPPIPFIYRAFSSAGIMQNSEGLYLLDFTERYADSPNGSYVYAMALVWSDEERSIDGVMEPLGPVSLYLNEQRLYRSSVIEELKPDGRVAIPLLFQKGWNTLLIEARKTVAGFGCRFGAEEGKVRILQVLSPFSNRTGQAGWVFSEPCPQSIYGQSQQLFPDWTEDEKLTELTWHPRCNWSEQELSSNNMERIFGYQSNAAACARTTLEVPALSDTVTMSLRTFGATNIYIEGQLVFSAEKAGAYTEQLQLSTTKQLQHVQVWSASGDQHWGFELSILEGNNKLPLHSPVHIHGYNDAWLYAGPISSEAAPIISNEAFAAHALLKQSDDKLLYWKLDAPDLVMRPFYENAMLSNKWTVGSMSNFARWDYPLGVTMYGLLRSGKQLNREDMVQYALQHISICADWYEYSRWDYEQYGFPSINHQLVLIKMLDNCGSFGSAMLEAYATTGNANYAAIAEIIADFILNKLERRKDGAFYRLCEGEYSANTMWADDLYMSTPFLIRYATLFNNQAALDEAAKQFLLYKSYLFIEDQKLMSHVYDFKYNRATRVPWGRGNGWVLFSLSELLERIGTDHPLYDELLAFYREFVEGVVSYQSDSGLWHQVVNEPSSYKEASCTAMFVYGIARGIRFGWLDGDVDYEAVVSRGWEGLTKHAIDRQGHVYGVCSGSRYSFAPDYYMYDLRTVVNDNHGIGIMMLAAVEVDLLRAAR